MGDDHEISPHCYVLDIGIQGVEDKIWVRADYIRMFKYCEKFYAESLPNPVNPLSPCLVITGQQGIGKSLWRWYALRVCCAQKKPVILYSGGTCLLFVEEGVFEQPTRFHPNSYKIVIWTLVDSADPQPTALFTHGTQHFVLYTTSPTPSRWNKIHQTMRLSVCVMNPWTKAEIYKAAPLRAPDVPLPAIEAIFNKFGTTPRLCFNTNLTDYQRGLNLALGKLSLANLENLTSWEGLELDAVSHKLCILRRSSIDDVHSEEEMQFISPFVRLKVVLRMRALKRHELVSLFNRFNALPSTRKMAKDVFEAFCHITFSTKIKFDFVKMVRIGGQPTARENMMAQWLSHSEFTSGPQSQKLNVLRSSALDSAVSLDLDPSRIVEYDSNEITGGLHIEADVYYIAITTNQVGIDSFIMHDETLYLFQMTVSETRDISDRLWPFLESLNELPPKHKWRFIFLKPPAKRLSCPVPHSAELLDLDLYSAEIKLM